MRHFAALLILTSLHTAMAAPSPREQAVQRYREAGFDESVAQRMAKRPDLVKKALGGRKLEPLIFYRGLRMQADAYRPDKKNTNFLKRGDKFAAMDPTEPFIYATDEAVKIRRNWRNPPDHRYHGVLLEMQLPYHLVADANRRTISRNDFSVTRLSTRQVPDDRTFLRRIGLVDLERPMPKTREWRRGKFTNVRWFTFDELFPDGKHMKIPGDKVSGPTKTR